jgi:hypothetical protein
MPVHQPFPMDSSVQPPAQQKSSKRWMLLAGIGLGVVVLGIGTTLLLMHRSTRPTTTATPLSVSTTTPPQTGQSPQTDTGDTSTKQYVSNGTDLNLRFSYPASWSVTPPTNSNTNDQPITLTSPVLSLTDADGKSVTAKAVVTIRPGGSQATELSSGAALISQDSTQIAYSSPTASQHQYPYLTFVHLAGGGNTKGVFDEVIITGITKFTKDQTLTAEGLSGLDPIISARFYQCSTDACSGAGATALDISSDMWQHTTLTQQTLAIFTSLQLN